jgi:hypothetical protein
MSYKQSNNPQSNSTHCVDRNPRSQAGTATVEMALLSPLLVLMFLGTIDFGRLFYDGITAANAARAGAQYAAQSKAKSEDTYGITQAAMADAENVDGVSVAVERYCECSNGSSVDCDDDCGIFDRAPRVYVRVRAEKTFETLFPYPGIPHTVNINQEAVIRAQ